MIQKLKNHILSILTLAMFALPLAVSGVAFAQGTTACPTSDFVCTGACTGAQTLQFSSTQVSCDSKTGETALNNTIKTIINILSVLVGVIAVIMIVIGGFRYITSGGDSTKVSAAKNTILYALVGLVIVALAQIIVKFVLTKAVSPTTT